jgi:hypothetical protein
VAGEVYYIDLGVGDRLGGERAFKVSVGARKTAEGMSPSASVHSRKQMQLTAVRSGGWGLGTTIGLQQ